MRTSTVAIVLAVFACMAVCDAIFFGGLHGGHTVVKAYHSYPVYKSYHSSYPIYKSYHSSYPIYKSYHSYPAYKSYHSYPVYKSYHSYPVVKSISYSKPYHGGWWW